MKKGEKREKIDQKREGEREGGERDGGLVLNIQLILKVRVTLVLFCRG